ncbi:MAG: hypothetical protein WDZ88_01640 [Candidatus Paceibacterota bacterium]
MAEILPAVMPESFSDLEEKMKLMEGLVSMVQVDVMDGIFVPSKSWPYNENDRESFTQLIEKKNLFPSWEKVSFEVDLMVANPEAVVTDWVTLGAKRIIVHSNATENMDEVIRILSGRVEIGIALHIDTPISVIERYKKHISVIQCMGIKNPGYQREPFCELVIPKIKEIKNAYPDIMISIDGGVNEETAPSLVSAGAERLVSGSAIFDSKNPKETILALASL